MVETEYKSINTEHDVDIPDEIAFEIPPDDPLRNRLETDEGFAREFVLEEQFN